MDPPLTELREGRDTKGSFFLPGQSPPRAAPRVGEILEQESFEELNPRDLGLTALRLEEFPP